MGHYHLGNALAVLHDEGLLGEVHEYDAHLATVIGVDGAGRIENGDAFLQGQSGAGAHLGFITGGEGQEKSGGNEAALQGLQRDGSVEIGAQVKAGTQRGGVLG